MTRSPWLKHSFLNVLEHGLTRIADAATSLVLLWVLSPGTFSKLAFAQAIVAPLLLVFVAPETVIYRDFAHWRERGASEIASRLRAFRLFAWGKGQLAIALSVVVAFFGSDWTLRFWSLVWAFALVLSAQISGPDREFLRLNLQLRELNAITLFQKISLLAGTVFASVVFPGRVDVLAAIAVFSALSTAVLCKRQVMKSLRAMGATEGSLSGREGAPIFETLAESLVGFSFWQHLNGVVIGWVQTMDLFFLGILRFPARELGLYAAVLKMANMATALPLALGNTFSLWLGRRVVEAGRARYASEELGLSHERKQLLKITLAMLVLVSIQAIALVLLGPWILRLLSHGRWLAEEQLTMMFWLKWIVAGSSLFAMVWPLASWLIVRSNIRRLFFRVYLFWGILSAGIYFALIRIGGMGEGGFAGAAQANVIVSLVYLGLLWLYLAK